MAKPSYITCTPTSGSNNGTVKVTCVSGYKGRAQRSGTISIGSKSVAVTQFGAPLYVNITANKTTADKDGDTINITGRTNGRVINVSTDNSAVFPISVLTQGNNSGSGSSSSKTVTPASDPGTNDEITFTVTIYVPSNGSTSTRSGRITATVQGDTSAQTASANINLSQQAGNATLNVSPTTLYFTADGVPCDANGDEISGATQANGQNVTVTSNTTWEVS